MPARNLEMLETVALGFGELIKRVVFVGGATLDLYVTDQAAPESRPLGDIDIVVGVSTLAEFHQLTDDLEQKGFKPKSTTNVHAQSWTYEGIPLHIMPMKSEIMGFYNRWYEEGVFHANSMTLPSGMQIRIFPPAYFLAAKIDAFEHRGEADFRMSEDFEDILYLLENRPEISQDVARAFYEVRDYIRKAFRKFLRSAELEEGIYNYLPFSGDGEIVRKLRSIMGQVAGGGVSATF